MKRSVILALVTIFCVFFSSLPAWAGDTHKVKRGETLSEIAEDHDISVSELADLNNVKDPDVLKEGQEIKVSVNDTHTVKSGDTLWALAGKYDTTWRQLYELNKDKIKNPDLIYPGQVLVVGSNADSSESNDDEPDPKPKKDKPDKPKPKPKKETDNSPSKVKPSTAGVTSSYGSRTHPITGEYKLHSGTDFGVGDGTANAAASGTVSDASYHGGYGNMVTIDHGDGIQTRYAHLARFRVSVGEKVDAGDVIGDIGSTGYSTGAHLHFEVLKNGEFRDPLGWLN